MFLPLTWDDLEGYAGSTCHAARGRARQAVALLCLFARVCGVSVAQYQPHLAGWTGPIDSHRACMLATLKKLFSTTLRVHAYYSTTEQEPTAKMFATTLARRMASRIPNMPSLPRSAPKPEPYFPLKKVWPPDFSKMSPQQQLRFEKRYKRRLRHISQRPGWDKAVQLAQFFTISCKQI